MLVCSSMIACFAVRQPAVIVVIVIVAFIALSAWQIQVRESHKRGVIFFVKEMLQRFVWVYARLTKLTSSFDFLGEKCCRVPLSKHRWKEEMKTHAGKFRPRIAHETGTGIWHLSHLARAARCDDDFFRFLAPFFWHFF